MTRDQALAVLRREKPRLVETYGVTKLALFGSTARDEAGPTSDVDIYVAVAKPNLFELGGMYMDLKEAMGTDVDLVHDHRRLSQSFRRRIERDGIHV